MLETTDCPLCGSPQFAVVTRGPDYFMHLPGQFTMVRCQGCNLLYQRPRPPLAEIGRFYPDSYSAYAVAASGARGQRGLGRHVLDRGMRRRCRRLDRAVPATGDRARKVLDVGCASGIFLEYMQQQPGWDIAGVELNQAAAQATSARLGAPIFAGPLEHADFPDGSFDAVTMWDVLEHLHEPLARLRDIRRILRPGGAFFTRLPNADSYLRRLCGRYWVGYDLPRHMTVFSPRTLRRALAATGFTPIYEASAGSYPQTIHSIHFALAARAGNAKRAASLYRALGHPLARAAAWLPFAIGDRLGGGSQFEMLAIARG